MEQTHSAHGPPAVPAAAAPGQPAGGITISNSTIGNFHNTTTTTTNINFGCSDFQGENSTTQYNNSNGRCLLIHAPNNSRTQEEQKSGSKRKTIQEIVEDAQRNLPPAGHPVKFCHRKEGKEMRSYPLIPSCVIPLKKFKTKEEWAEHCTKKDVWPYFSHITNGGHNQNANSTKTLDVGNVMKFIEILGGIWDRVHRWGKSAVKVKAMDKFNELGFRCHDGLQAVSELRDVTSVIKSNIIKEMHDANVCFPFQYIKLAFHDNSSDKSIKEWMYPQLQKFLEENLGITFYAEEERGTKLVRVRLHTLLSIARDGGGHLRKVLNTVCDETFGMTLKSKKNPQDKGHHYIPFGNNGGAVNLYLTVDKSRHKFLDNPRSLADLQHSPRNKSKALAYQLVQTSIASGASERETVEFIQELYRKMSRHLGKAPPKEESATLLCSRCRCVGQPSSTVEEAELLLNLPRSDARPHCSGGILAVLKRTGTTTEGSSTVKVKAVENSGSSSPFTSCLESGHLAEHHNDYDFDQLLDANEIHKMIQHDDNARYMSPPSTNTTELQAPTESGSEQRRGQNEFLSSHHMQRNIRQDNLTKEGEPRYDNVQSSPFKLLKQKRDSESRKNGGGCDDDNVSSKKRRIRASGGDDGAEMSDVIDDDDDTNSDSEDNEDDDADECEEETYQVEKVLETKYNKKTKRFEWLIKWDGYDENTWEPWESFQGSKDVGAKLLYWCRIFSLCSIYVSESHHCMIYILLYI